MSLMKAIENEAKEKGLEIEDNLFEDRSEAATDAKEEQGNIEEDDKSIENDIDSEKNDVIKETPADEEDIEKELEILGKTTSDLEEAIIDISDTGTYKQKGFIFNNKISYVFETSTVGYSKEYVEFFAKNKFEMQSEVDYYYALFSVASILKEFSGSALPDGLIKRAEIIEEKIKGPIYKILLNKADEFHRFTDILSSPKVESFLQEESIS